MAKTQAPSKIEIGPNTFITNALPDPFDERDLKYLPRLSPLPDSLDQRDTTRRKSRYVLTQQGNSCTGHAVASVINTVLLQARLRRGSRSRAIVKVSPYMLYWLARRYDEYEGEDDAGSSLRGVFKAWFNHGVCPEDLWKFLDTEVDLDDKAFVQACANFPLGAYYRVNPYRLDDMQSAITELNAIAVSGVVHDGWLKPVEEPGARGKSLHVIRRSSKAEALGGHAFALVGYNHVGFLVQNSWGEGWGKGGYATLPYDDWLDNAYDAWVARPGVPQTPFRDPRSRAAMGTQGALVTASGPDVQRLAAHVVNLGNNGRLSRSGRFTSTPTQIDKLFESMRSQHAAWLNAPAGALPPAGGKRHILLWAHGGMVSENSALKLAQRQLQWWLNNHVYPVTFAWQTGPIETLFSQLSDLIRGKLPAGVVRFDFIEQLDRLVEQVARANFSWAWEEMKENAWAACERLEPEEQAHIHWPPAVTHEAGMSALPGGSLFVHRLAKYVHEVGAQNIALHVAGHSAGTIFAAALLARLVEAGLEVQTLSLLAGALRVDQFHQLVLPHLGKSVKRTTFFNLSDERELDDRCPPEGLAIYHKSLLYMVSRGLELDKFGRPFEIPLIGLQAFNNQPAPVAGSPIFNTLLQGKVEVVVSPSAATDDARSDAKGHGDFDDDVPTMTSLLLRLLGLRKAQPLHTYRANSLDASLPAAAALPASATVPAGVARDPGARKTTRKPRPGAKTLTRAALTAGPVDEPAQETAVAVKTPKARKR